VVYQRLRTGEISERHAGEALSRFLELNVQLVEPTGIYQTAVSISRAHRLTTTYDSLYVAVALHLEADLWTSDRRLKASLGARFPWVRLIESFPVKSV
jgi:predicted nucleic acid-binding protein